MTRSVSDSDGDGRYEPPDVADLHCVTVQRAQGRRLGLLVVRLLQELARRTLDVDFILTRGQKHYTNLVIRLRGFW